jgi:hypothetical protein
MKKMLALVVPFVVTNPMIYGMKRPRPDTQNILVTEYGPSHKKVEGDTRPSFLTPELQRGIVFLGFKVRMNLEDTMPREQLDQFQKNFENYGITGEDKLGLLLQQFYMASMNNIHAGSRAKMGGPDKYIVNGEIVFE